MFKPLYVNLGQGMVINPELSQEEVDSLMAAQKVSNVEALWQAAHDYEYSEISGSAIGLVTIGVLQSKPKCVAVQDWIKSIWTLYYQRKAAMGPEFSPSLDFSSCGPCPHTVPELMEELGM